MKSLRSEARSSRRDMAEKQSEAAHFPEVPRVSMSDLHEAAEQGFCEQIQAAIRRGADPNMCDEAFGARCDCVVPHDVVVKVTQDAPAPCRGEWTPRGSQAPAQDGCRCDSGHAGWVHPCPLRRRGWTVRSTPARPSLSRHVFHSLSCLIAIVEACPSSNRVDNHGDLPLHYARVCPCAMCISVSSPRFMPRSCTDTPSALRTSRA